MYKYEVRNLNTDKDVAIKIYKLIPENLDSQPAE